MADEWNTFYKPEWDTDTAPELLIGFGDYIFGFSEAEPDRFWILQRPKEETEEAEFEALCKIQDTQELLRGILHVYNTRDKRKLRKLKKSLTDRDRGHLNEMLIASRKGKSTWKLGHTWSLRYLIADLAGRGTWTITERVAPGYVYLIQSPSGYYKIGKTINPTNRMKTFTVKLPFEVEYLALIPTQDRHSLERELHKLFDNKRVNGEWFQLDANDVAHIKNLAVQS